MTDSIPLIQIKSEDSCSTKKPVHPSELIREIPRKALDGSNVLFINMPLRVSAKPNIFPEGPGLLGTRLSKNFGVNVSMIDFNAYRIKDELWQRMVAAGENLPHGRLKTFQEAEDHIRRHLKVYGVPDLIGLSGKITTYRWQKEIVRIIRSILPDVFLVTGNGLATELRLNLFQFIPELDGVAHSEGDDVIIKIVHDAVVIKQMGFENALNAGKLNPYYAGCFNGRHRFLYEGDRPLDLNALPHVDFDLFEYDVDGNRTGEWYRQVPDFSRQANNSSAIPWDDADVVPKTNSVSSRGCPFGCKYCFRGSQGERKWGVRSAEHIMRELHERIDRYKIKFHGFPDDNFAVTLDRIKDINNIVAWGTHTRLDEVAGLNNTTRHTAEIMAKAGCIYIGFGPESASPKVIEAIGKGGHTLSNGMIDVSIKGWGTHSFAKSMIMGNQNAIENGIHGNNTWILGCPTETLDDLKETVLYMLWQMGYYSSKGLPEDSVNTRMFTLTWYPGTTIINYPEIRHELNRVFGLSFSPVAGSKSSGVQYEPVFDETFEKYMLELDDATKVLYGPNGEPLNFGDMPTDTFLKAREYINSGETLRILEM